MFLASVTNLEESFDAPVYSLSSKEPMPLNLYKSCQEENCNLSYIEESHRCLENRVKEHNSHVTSTVYKDSISDNHP